MKKTIIISFLLLLSLPFIFIKTLYPFYRFGMFAEPVKTSIQTEKFSIHYQQLDGKWIEFLGPEIGLSKSGYSILMRKHYYQNQVVELLQKTASVVKNQHNAWEMWRITQHDSTKVGQWHP